MRSLLALFVRERCASLRASAGAQLYLLYQYKHTNVLTPKELAHTAGESSSWQGPQAATHDDTRSWALLMHALAAFRLRHVPLVLLATRKVAGDRELGVGGAGGGGGGSGAGVRGGGRVAGGGASGSGKKGEGAAYTRPQV